MLIEVFEIKTYEKNHRMKKKTKNLVMTYYEYLICVILSGWILSLEFAKIF